MARQAVVMGSSAYAYELERIAAQPEVPAIPAIPRRREREQVFAEPSVQTRERLQAREAARTVPRQHVSIFGVLGYFAVGVMLLLVVLSHMQLALVTHETVRLEGEVVTLQEESDRLRIAYETAFHEIDIERFAREELGMVDAGIGQVFYIGTTLRDTAEILVPEETSNPGILEHIAELFAGIGVYLPFLS